MSHVWFSAFYLLLLAVVGVVRFKQLRAEREQLRRAIDLLMDDAGYFQEAMMILGKLAGIRFPAFEAMASKDFKSVDIRDLMRAPVNVEDDEFDALSLHATNHCVKWGCEKAKLVKRGRFWCCPRCGASYGEYPAGV